MAKLTLTDGTIFEGTTEEIFAITERFNGVKEEEVAKTNPLKLGDSVIISGKSVFDVDLDGELGVYGGTSIHFTPSHARVCDVGGKGYVVKYEQLRKATDEEVAEAKALAEQSAKEAIFTQAGRKPNEYRKGDIVRVVKESNGHDVGIIGEVTVDEISDRPDVKARNKSGRAVSLFSYVEPITFVESRLDRN